MAFSRAIYSYKVSYLEELFIELVLGSIAVVWKIKVNKMPRIRVSVEYASSKYGPSNTASNVDNLNNQFLIFYLCYASADHISYSLEACVGGSSYTERVPVRIGKRM
jgi:hypothetical protein